MRVIGGKLRGKLIHNPTDKTTRPLKDMVCLLYTSPSPRD